MSIATKVAALLGAVRRQDVEQLPPAERQRLANLCRYVASLAEPQDEALARKGMLPSVRSGRRPD